MATKETATPLGTCLLICPQDYETSVNRRNYEEDVKNIKLTFAAKYSIEDYHIDIIDSSKKFLHKLDTVQSPSFLLYFTGYGGCDSNGQVYILLRDKPEQKVKLCDIVSKLQRKCPCILLFELSCRHGDDIASPILKLPTCNNFVVAISSLIREEKRNYNGGIWTKSLCDTVKEYQLPMTTILDLVWHKCTSSPHYFYPQYTASRYKPKPSEVISDEWYLQFIFGPSSRVKTPDRPPSKSGNGEHLVHPEGFRGRVYKTSDTPCSGHVFQALTNQGIADKWRQIGGKLQTTILDPNKLKNIRGDNAAAIRLMISKCNNLKWYHVTGAIRNSCGKDKADGITKFLESPHSCPKCSH